MTFILYFLFILKYRVNTYKSNNVDCGLKKQIAFNVKYASFEMDSSFLANNLTNYLLKIKKYINSEDLRS